MRLLILLFCLCCPLSLFAWSSHFVLTTAVLKQEKDLWNPTIHPETLDNFLKKEKTGIQELLAQTEKWAQNSISYYPPLPKNLEFGKETNIPIQLQFAHALRINPNLNFPLYLQFSTKPHRISGNPIERSKVMLNFLADATWMYIDSPPLEGITEKQLVSPAEIITTASDEPDYGMDLNLFEDNHSTFGKLYHFGTEPFGNKDVSFATQAPFHMGFYYESWIIYKLASFFKESYLTYRLHTYLELSKYAFKTHHDYWGYRFLGWALHYAQDLTQPYHATVGPNISPIKVVYLEILNKLGFPTPKQNTVILVTNRHYALEDYQYFWVRKLLAENAKDNIILKYAQDTSTDSKYPPYSDSYAQDVIAKEANARANDVDTLVRNAFPSLYVKDTNYIFYMTDPSIDLVTVVGKKRSENLEKLDQMIAEIMQSYGAHTRNIIKYATSFRPIGKP